MEYIKLKNFQMILQQAIQDEWSDIHLTVGQKVYYRKKNDLYLWDKVSFSVSDFQEVITTTLKAQQLEKFKQKQVIDYAYELSNRRFRINIYAVYKGYSMAIRLINNQVVSLTDFAQQKTLQTLLQRNSGMILICGATGTGKSTTLAAMIEFINQRYAKHIITLEEPIEYVFNSKQALIHQREYQIDFTDFSSAIKMAMRQDPDVIMVGEIRDEETMKACLNAGETGHLVLGTLHASSVVEAILRMESFFETEQLNAVNLQIASALNSIIVQKLVPTIEHDLSCCMDILINNIAVKNLISNHQLAQLKSQMQLSKKQGMQFMKDDIMNLYKLRKITDDVMKMYL